MTPSNWVIAMMRILFKLKSINALKMAKFGFPKLVECKLQIKNLSSFKVILVVTQMEEELSKTNVAVAVMVVVVVVTVGRERSQRANQETHLPEAEAQVVEKPTTGQVEAAVEVAVAEVEVEAELLHEEAVTN